VGADPRTAGAFAAAFEAAPVNPELFERLRATRKRLADAEGVPAYIIFSDAVLRHMAARVPASAAEMLAIPGIGPVKLERYGAAFLDALRGD
jgi:ATP-dependent DNA helicase RecQ